MGQYRSDPKHPTLDERNKKPRPFEGVERVAPPARKAGMFDGMSPEAAQMAGKRMMAVVDCTLQREKASVRSRTENCGSLKKKGGCGCVIKTRS